MPVMSFQMFTQYLIKAILELGDSYEFIVNIQTPQGLRFLSYLCFPNLHLYAVLLNSVRLIINSQVMHLSSTSPSRGGGGDPGLMWGLC